MWIVTDEHDYVWKKWLVNNIGPGKHILSRWDNSEIRWLYTDFGEELYIVFPKYDEDPFWRLFKEKFGRKQNG